MKLDDYFWDFKPESKEDYLNLKSIYTENTKKSVLKMAAYEKFFLAAFV